MGGGNRVNIKDNVRATMAENKILNVGRTLLEIEMRALSLSSRLPSREPRRYVVNENEFESEWRLYHEDLISQNRALSRISRDKNMNPVRN